MTRRSLLATLAAIFLPRPKALPPEEWTVDIGTGPSYESGASLRANEAFMARYSDDKVNIIEHHFVYENEWYVAHTIGEDILDVQRDLTRDHLG